MSDFLPSLSENRAEAQLFQDAADERHGDADKRLRNRRSRRVAKKALAYTVGGALAVFAGGPMVDKGLDQIDRFAQPTQTADTPSTLTSAETDTTGQRELPTTED